MPLQWPYHKAGLYMGAYWVKRVGPVTPILQDVLRVVLKPAQRLFLPRLIAKMKRMGPVDDVEELLDIAFCGFLRSITPLQLRSEIGGLLERVKALLPLRVMEIGTARGGTLFLLSRVAAAGAQLISVDLPGGSFGGGYAAWLTPLLQCIPLS